MRLQDTTSVLSLGLRGLGFRGLGFFWLCGHAIFRLSRDYKPSTPLGE